jgi:DNA-binding beta-propeller fold protein YncE
VINVALAEQGSPNAVVGTLKSSGLGAIQVAFSPDGKFAFVTLEDSEEAAVYNLAKALKQGFGSSDFVGDIPLGPLPVGMVVSPDGSTLYATSEGSDPCLTGGTTCPSGGTLSVINLPEAETDPADSVVNTVGAGCGTVRVITSADGSQVWVTARESDAVLLFSAAALQSNPQNALTYWFRVGEAPVDLTLVNGGTRLLVANSNRFNVQGQQADVGVVKVAAAASAQSPVLGTIGSGLFPREFAVEANGTTALLDNYGSGQVESIDLSSLP